MTDPLETLLVNAEWHAVELKRDRSGPYLQEVETENVITTPELVKRYNALLRSPAPAATVTGWRLVDDDSNHVQWLVDAAYEISDKSNYKLTLGTVLDIVRKHFDASRRLTPPAQGDEMRALTDMADRWEREYLSTGMKNVYRNAVDCANELRSAVAAVRGAGGEGE